MPWGRERRGSSRPPSRPTTTCSTTRRSPSRRTGATAAGSWTRCSRWPRGSSRRGSSRRPPTRRARPVTSGSSARRRRSSGGLAARGGRRASRRPVARLEVAVAAALAQEALELAGDRVAAGDVARIEVGPVVVRGLFETLDERLHVGVALYREVHLALVFAGAPLELGRIDRDSDQTLELADQRQRSLRIRRGGDV